MPDTLKELDFRELTIGAVFVLIYAAGRFNTPPTNRCCTTALRYHLAASCYLLVELILYLGLLYFGPKVVPEAGFFAQAVTHESAAPLAALLLTVLLPKVPLLADADAKLLKRLHRMGAIPSEAARLAAELRRSRFTVPEHLREEHAARLASLGFPAADGLIHENGAFEDVWRKITALMIQLEEWESEGDGKFAVFLERFPDELKKLRTQYDELTPTVQLLRGLPPEGVGPRSDRLMVHVQSEIKERSTELLNSIYRLISQGLLQCGVTYAARTAALAKLGFDSRGVIVTPRVTLNQLITLFLAIEGALLASMVIFVNEFGGTFLLTATMVSTMYTVAVVCAVYPKQRWRFARRERSSMRPAAFYVVAGLLAAAASLAIRFVFQLMILHDLTKALDAFEVSAPWTLCAFIAAFMVAWMIDDEPAPRLPRNRLRCLEALAGGGALLLGSFLAVLWMETLAASSKGSHSANLQMAPPSHWWLALPVAIGCGIGWLIPTWYREANRQTSQLGEIAPGGELADVPA